MVKPTLVIEVSGSGAFPLDMLRYDRLTPLTESDSGLIERTFTGARGSTSVRLVGNRCTKQRWESFGWKTKEVTL